MITQADGNKGKPTIAHVRQDGAGEWLTHDLYDHLQGTAQRAKEFASSFGASDWAELAGWWHDLGKFKEDFQSYIRSASRYDADAHLENIPGKVDHSAAGAIHACERDKGKGRILAYLIAGHHAGLPDWYKGEVKGRGLCDRLGEAQHLGDAKAGKPPVPLLSASLPTSLPPRVPEQAHLWIRMLFSCLVDADFLDTEKFMSPEKAEQRGNQLGLRELSESLNHSMAERDQGLQASGIWDSPVNQVRRSVLQDCLNSADNSPGFFTLTVPTGGGKTLSSIAFALKHALKHEKRKIIVAIPYTSIIEQTCDVLRKVFGEDAILEHHSNLDPDRETHKSRLATENWDAPIVVTTNVQLFESLFANRTSACRKLHNIANSVIVLDEAQMLLPELLMPTLSVLKGLVEHFGCTVVLCTATQPALTGTIGSGQAQFVGLAGAREIVADPAKLSQQLKRVEVRLRGADKVAWADLAADIASAEKVLCVVNRRADCRELFELVQGKCTRDPIHLSALMCGEHRSQVIQRIRWELSTGFPVRVISTQLVEAGVDIDFPMVYRAMAGLDSIAQAAGRCNREGKLNATGQLGQVIVFNPPKPSPRGLLLKGEQVCAELLRTMEVACRDLAPDAFTKYFECFFGSVNDHGRKEFEHFLLTNAGSCQFQFASAAKWYRLIDDEGSRGIIIWYEGDRFSSMEILEELRRLGPSLKRMRRLQRCSVNVPTRAFLSLKQQGAIAEVNGPDGPMDLWAQCVPKLYDPLFGLRLEGPDYDGTEFVH